MKTKKNISIDKLMHNYFKEQVKSEHQSNKKYSHEISGLYSVIREKIYDAVFAFSLIIMFVISSFYPNKPGLLEKRIIAYYEFKQIDKQIYNTIDYIIKLDIFEIRRNI